MAWYKPWTWGDESQSAQDQRANLNNQAGMGSAFADIGQQNYGAATNQLDQDLGALRRRANGQDSLSAEQLRQGLQQQFAQARSMAAAASPQNAAMAARTAAMGMNRAASGMAGNTAMAGIAERQAAQDALARAMLERRGQDVNVALGSRQNAISGYGGIKPEGSFLDKWGGAITGAASLYGNRGGGK